MHEKNKPLKIFQSFLEQILMPDKKCSFATHWLCFLCGTCSQWSVRIFWWARTCSTVSLQRCSTTTSAALSDGGKYYTIKTSWCLSQRQKKKQSLSWIQWVNKLSALLLVGEGIKKSSHQVSQLLSSVPSKTLSSQTLGKAVPYQDGGANFEIKADYSIFKCFS